MRAKYVHQILEGYGVGAGLSYTGGVRGMSGSFTRGGFGGASNMGGPNLSYTYEIRPLNHTLEPRPSFVDNSPQLKIGSVIVGDTIRSNAYPEPKRVKGVLHKIVTSDNGSVKYYIVQDFDTQTSVKLDPLSVSLVIAEPVNYYYDVTDSMFSRRREKIRAQERKVVRESLRS